MSGYTARGSAGRGPRAGQSARGDGHDPWPCTSGRSPASRSRSRPSSCGATAGATTWSCAACRSSTAASRTCSTSGATSRERKRAERALRDSEEQYRAIFNASADALVLRDADYRVVDVNPAYKTMSGYTREEVMAADQVLTSAPTRRCGPRHRAAARARAGGRAGADSRSTGTRKDGSTIRRSRCAACRCMYRGEPHVLYVGAGHHRAPRRRSSDRGAAGGAAAPGAEDGGDRPAHRRHRARLQQHPAAASSATSTLAQERADGRATTRSWQR